MASNPTARNRFNKQGTGDNAGTWGIVLNGQALDLIDEAIDGITAIPVSGDISLTSTNYASDQARRRVLKLTGTPGATFTITIPSVEKVYLVHNTSNAPQLVKAGGVGVLIGPGALKTVYCDGTDCFTTTDTLTAPVGLIADFGTPVAPAGWLLCAGQAVSRSTYSLLYAAIGTTWGSGNGSTTFNVPDRNGIPGWAAPDNMGGVDKGRLTHLGPNRNVIGARVGEAQHTMTEAEMVTHTHSGSVTVSYPPHQYFAPNNDSRAGSGGSLPLVYTEGLKTLNTSPPANTTPSFTTNGTGSTSPFNVTPLTNIGLVCIYAGV